MLAKPSYRRYTSLRTSLPHVIILALSFLKTPQSGLAQTSSEQGHSISSQTHPSASPQAITEEAREESKALQQIQSMLQQGHIAEAKTALQAYLNRYPSSVQAYNLLGIIDSNQQDFDGALIAFHTALRLAPNSARTHVNLGNVYLLQKKADLAEKEFRLALRIDPKDQEANYNLAVLLMATQSFAQAIPYLEQIHPANAATRFNLIRAYFETRRTDQALRMATELSSENASSVQVHFSLGLLLASERQAQAAQTELLKADALEPNTFEILLNLGTSFLQSNNPARAALTLSRALELKPDSAQTLYWLARTSQAQAHPLDALDYLIRARKLAPENADILLLMAQISMAQNYFEDAIPLLESGVKLTPNRPDFHAALGEAYFMAGKSDQAIAEFKRWIEIEPSARSYAFLGIANRNLGRFEDATQSFHQGLKLDPKNNTCQFNLGLIAQRQGDISSAEARFLDVLRTDPNYAEALLELANLYIAAKKLVSAEPLLRKYVQVNPNAPTGYYKLAMVERSMHQTEAADRDLATFQSLSRDVAPSPHVSEHLFDYLDTRSKLSSTARDELDLNEITEQVKKHPDQPEALYLLVSTYLKAGRGPEAKEALAQLDTLSSNDNRTLIGTGVLLARYHLYDEAIQHFQSAIAVDPGSPSSDEAYFDLADAYFRKGLYTQALEAAKQVSDQGQKQSANLSLMADIYAHLNDATRAETMYSDAIACNPDNDQDYLSLALLLLHTNDLPGARQTLLKGQSRIPVSGKIVWGLALVSALEGKTADASADFERAVELLPEWTGSYSTLGFFYFLTGQIDKAREVTSRFKSSRSNGVLDLNRIGQALAQSPAQPSSPNEPLTPEKKQQLLQLALSLVDQTL